MNSSVSLPITDDTGVVFKHVAFSLQKSHNGSPWFSVSPKLFNNIIHSERCAIPTVWVKDFLCTSQNPPGGYIMLFVLSVQMKPETIYYHPDIASHWQITLLLLEWWLGMAEQKFMNSQCGRLGRESGWRSWRHKAKRQLVFLFLCHGVRKCFIFCGEKEIQRTELTFIEAKWWTIWFRKGTVSGDVKKAVISSDRSRGRECVDIHDQSIVVYVKCIEWEAQRYCAVQGQWTQHCQKVWHTEMKYHLNWTFPVAPAT